MNDKPKIILISIVTSIITSFVTIVIVSIILTFVNNANNVSYYSSDDEYAEDTGTDYSAALQGKWKPIEMSDKSLEFSYGTVKVIDKHDFDVKWNYSINNNILTFSVWSGSIDIYSQAGKDYLEIYGMGEYSGKYERVK